MMIIEELAARNMQITHKKFATPIRDVVSTLTGLPISLTESTEGKAVFIEKAGKTVGKILQDVGSALKKVVHDEVWIDAAMCNVRPDENLIFSDVRFPKELETVKKRNGVVIEVRRCGSVEMNPLAGRSTLHESETALKDCEVDYVIENNGTVDDLRAQVRILLEKLLRDE